MNEWLDHSVYGRIALDETAAPKRLLAWSRASDVEMKRAAWLWETGEFGRIPVGEVSVAAGRGNVGKSPFALWCCARLSRGELPGEFYGQPVVTAVYASEDSHAHTTVPRLIAAGADCDLVHLITGTRSVRGDDDELDWVRDIRLIEEHLVQSGAKFLVIDPLFDVYKSGADTNKSDDVRRGLRPLVAMAHRIGVTILGLAHFNKNKTTDVASMLSGSHGLRDIVRAVLVFVEGPGGQKVLGQDKNNLGRSGDDVPRITYDMVPVNVIVGGAMTEVPVFSATGHTAATIGELVAGDAEGDDIPLSPDVDFVFRLVHQAGGYPVTAKMLEAEVIQHGWKWDTVSRKAKRSKLVEAFKEAGEMHSPWLYRLTEAGRRRANSDAA